MINIDGTKVKTLREKHNLTQLYVATVVGVTTDTISRWENKRYPTIKEENAIKLAEALEVELEAILEELDEEPITTTIIGDTSSFNDDNKTEATQKPVSPNEIAITQSPLTSNGKTKWLLPLCILAVLVTVSVLVFFQFKESTSMLSATRQTPSHYIPGLPFPVVITVEVESNQNSSYVVKEKLPQDATIVATSPEIQVSKIKNNTVKWLKKGNIDNRFIYTLKVDPEKIVNRLSFSGNITSSKNKTLASIEGSNSCEPSMYHWADQNKDNRISDQEILNAYDLYIGAPSIDFETIEEIWMGTGYRWDGKNQEIKLLP